MDEVHRIAEFLFSVAESSYGFCVFHIRVDPFYTFSSGNLGSLP